MSNMKRYRQNGRVGSTALSLTKKGFRWQGVGAVGVVSKEERRWFENGASGAILSRA